MPIATGVTAPELPTTFARQESLVDCLSPGVTPKVYNPLLATNDANTHIGQWCPSLESMPQMLQAPPTNMYGYPPGAVMLVPFPCLMDQTRQAVQYPCPVNQSPSTLCAPVLNNFHMPHVCESDASDDELQCTATGNDASQFAAGIDAAPSSHRGSTCELADDSKERYEELGFGNPRQMLTDAGLASSIVDLLESSSTEKRTAITTWMQPAVLDLALSANGTRVIQKALELTGGETQIILSHCLHGRVRQLLDSHHGNHVLQKCVVVMPPHAIQFIFHELSFFRGGWADVACHRFGCRVIERLLEHCNGEFTAPIVEAVVAEIVSLSVHPFANYVIQHILEYVPAHRSQVVYALIRHGVSEFAHHRVASNIVERAFEHCGFEDQQALAEAILSTPGAVVDLAFNRYGSFTVRRMLESLQGGTVLHYMALQQLGEAIPGLQASRPGRPIAKILSRMLSETDGGSA